MKVLKFEIQDMPDSFSRPYVEMVRYPKMDPKMFSDSETVSYEDTVQVTKELYPLQGLALGNHQEWFYIRDKDKKAIETVLKGFIDKAKRDLLDEIIDEGNTKEVWNYILELRKNLRDE